MDRHGRQQFLVEETLSLLTEPDRRPIYEWARDHVRLTGNYTVTGFFNVDISRFMIEPFNALGSHGVRTVTVAKPVQSGGSLIGDIWLAWIIANDPGPMMVNLQTDAIAKDYAELRTWPVLKKCKPVRAVTPTSIFKQKTQECYFSNGMALYIQGPSIANLQTKGIRYQVNDEIWLWPAGRLKDAVARTSAFEEMEISKVYNCGQGGWEGDEFDTSMKSGDSCEWTVACMKCGKYDQTKFTGIRDDGSRFGIRFDRPKDYKSMNLIDYIGSTMETVRYECRCGHVSVWSDRLKTEWNRTGRYDITKPNAPKSRRSFHWNSIVIRSHKKLVHEFLLAKDALNVGNVDPMEQFVQKELAESSSEAQLSIESPILASKYVPNEEWPEEQARFMYIDTQVDGLKWVVARAWSDTEARFLCFRKCIGWEDCRAVQEEFRIPDRSVFADYGHDPQSVGHACAEFGWFATKGTDRHSFPFRSKKTRKLTNRLYSEVSSETAGRGTKHQGRMRKYPLINLATNGLKNFLMYLRKSKTFKWSIPLESDDDLAEYKKQLNAEVRRPDKSKKTGKTIWIWKQIRRDNHALDCEVGLLVGPIARKILHSSTDASPEDSRKAAAKTS